MSSLTFDQVAKVPLWPTKGFSSENNVIHNSIQNTVSDFMRANSISAPLRDIRIELESLREECSEPDWDGYGAKIISCETIEIAEEFAECFVFLELPTPEIRAEPTGAIGFESEKSTTHSLILSIDSKGEIAYVGFYGANRAKGIERFTDRIPDEIIYLIRRLYT
jgi:hypothetical protein